MFESHCHQRNAKHSNENESSFAALSTPFVCNKVNQPLSQLLLVANLPATTLNAYPFPAPTSSLLVGFSEVHKSLVLRLLIHIDRIQQQGLQQQGIASLHGQGLLHLGVPHEAVPRVDWQRARRTRLFGGFKKG